MGPSLSVLIWAQLIIPQCFKWQVKLISILHWTLIQSAETRSSRSSAVEELLAAPHKKKSLFLSFLEEQKRKEVHVQCSLEGAIWWREAKNRKKNWAMERWSEKGMTLCLHLWKTSSIVEICLQLFRDTHQTAVILLCQLLFHQFFSDFFTRATVWNLNLLFMSTKSTEKLQDFSLWMKIAPPQTYRNILIDNINNDITNRKLVLKGDGWWEGGLWERKEAIILTSEELMIIGLRSPPTCQPDGICCLHSSTNYN